MEFSYTDMNIYAKSGKYLEIETIPKLSDLGVYLKYPLSSYALLIISLVVFIFIIIYITISY